MSDSKVTNIREIPSIIGAEIKGFAVVVDEKEIPRLRCVDRGDNIEIILDNRFSYTFPKSIVNSVVRFVANAMAIGEGYSHFGAEDKNHPFAPTVINITLP